MDYIALHGGMNVNNDMKSIWKQTIETLSISPTFALSD
jgi:hypothetical protein